MTAKPQTVKFGDHDLMTAAGVGEMMRVLATAIKSSWASSKSEVASANAKIDTLLRNLDRAIEARTASKVEKSEMKVMADSLRDFRKEYQADKESRPDEQITRDLGELFSSLGDLERRVARKPEILKPEAGKNGKSLEFEWDGSKLRVRQQGGIWSEWHDLRGPTGLTAEPMGGFGTIPTITDIIAGSNVTITKTGSGKYIISSTTGTGSTGSIIAATDSGDHKNYTLAQAPTTSSYYVIINNGMYTTDDPTFGFSVTGTTLTFSSALPSDLAGTLIKLVCV